jgi:folate-binding protein YgfZ
MPLDAETERGYWVARKGVAVMDLSLVGRLKMTGADALDLVHRLCTQDVKNLKPGQGNGATLTNEKGRVLDVINVYVFPDHLFLFTGAGNQGKTAAWLEKYTITEDVQTADVTAETGLVSFAGANAKKLAAIVAGPEAEILPRYCHLPANIGGPQAFLTIGGPFGGGTSFSLVLKDRKDVPKALDYLLTKGEPLGADLVGPRVHNVLRIEAGAPMFGREVDERFNPLEAGMERLVSFTKGCYIGQEVIARLDSYHKVQKRLVGLFLPDGSPQSGDDLYAGEHKTGSITSATFSPTLKKDIALAYVRTGDAAPGTKLIAKTEQGERPVEVTALPFLP